MSSGFWDYTCDWCQKVVAMKGPHKRTLCSDCFLEAEDIKHREELEQQAAWERQQEVESEKLLERIEELEERISKLEESEGA